MGTKNSEDTDLAFPLFLHFLHLERGFPFLGPLLLSVNSDRETNSPPGG